MRCLVLGAGGFLGGAMVDRLKAEGRQVTAVHRRQWKGKPIADFTLIDDLRHCSTRAGMFAGYDEVYQFAANMGGAGYLFSGKHDAEVMRDNVSINANVLATLDKVGFPGVLFFASSACVYPESDGELVEGMEAPASAYGHEKLFSERMYLAHAGRVRIGRLDTVYGPGASYVGGREKAPMAFCHKVASAPEGGSVDVWGTGEQTRAFLFVDDMIDGILALTRSSLVGPVNIGAAEAVSMKRALATVIGLSGKNLIIVAGDGPVGVINRRVSSRRLTEATGWTPRVSLETGLDCTYRWVSERLSGTAYQVASL